VEPEDEEITIEVPADKPSAGTPPVKPKVHPADLPTVATKRAAGDPGNTCPNCGYVF